MIALSWHRRGPGAAIVCLLVALAAAASGESPYDSVVERRIYVMGTHATMTAFAPSRAAGHAQLTRAVRVLTEADRELSTWSDASLLSRLNRQPVGEPRSVPSSLCVLLEELAVWRAATDGAFDPAIGSLLDAWGVREGGRQPSHAALRTARRRAGLHHFQLFSGCRVMRRVDAWIDAGAFGKGAALDRVRRRVSDVAWMVDLGGQVAVGGSVPPMSWPVAVAHPSRRDHPVLALQLSSGSVAVTGGSERDVVVHGHHVGHVIDPRTGYPVRRHYSVAVWHPRALVADILSTALYVMGEDAGLVWASERRIAAAFIAPAGADGAVDVAATPAFDALPQQRLSAVDAPP